MSLENQIEGKRKEMHTDAYPMSIGEIINLYTEGDLDIHPEFQRIYRWSPLQKSRLIESILLGIPLPSFFMAQREDGIWDVVDGLQRLSTIFSFLGIYRNEKGVIEPPFVLMATDNLPELEGVRWEADHEGAKSFSKELQRSFKREKIDLKIIKKESDDQAKYELFQRLNTFGSALSDQEVRNCLLLMLDKSFYEWLQSLADFEGFKVSTLSISDRMRDEQYQLELVLRFLILRTITINDLKGVRDIGDFITKKMKDSVKNSTYDKAKEKKAFEETFSLLNKALGEEAFRKYENSRYTGGFSLSVFEVMALGLGRRIDGYDINNDAHISKIKEISKSLLENSRFNEKRGVGLKASDRLPHLIPLADELFKLS